MADKRTRLDAQATDQCKVSLETVVPATNTADRQSLSPMNPMTNKQLPPDWAIAAGLEKTKRAELFEDGLSGELGTISLAEAYMLGRVDAFQEIEQNARELSAQQPDAARGEHCPKCNFTMSGVGHCVNCAEQPARDGVDSLSGYVEYLREDKATKYSDPCNAAVQTERLRIADELEAIGASSPPQPADGEAVYQLRPNVLNGANWADVSEQDYQQALTRPDLIEARTLYLCPTRGLEVTEEDCHKAMDAAEYFNSNTNISLGAMRAALTSFTYTIMERDKREAALSGVQR